MNKRIMLLVLVSLLILGSFTTSVYADKVISDASKQADLKKEVNEEIVIKTKKIEVDKIYDGRINYPEIKGMSDKEFEEKINKEIKRKVENYVSDFEKEAKFRNDKDSELYVGYEVRANDRVLSIILNSYSYISGDANGQSESSYYNLDKKNSKVLKLEDLFREGINFEEIINNDIKSQIAVREDDLLEGKDGFNGIKEMQDFYIDEYGNLVISFQEYEIGPKSAGSPEFIIDLNSIIDYMRPELIVKPVVLGKVIDLNLKNDARAVVPQVKGLDDLKVEQEINKSMNDVVVGEINKFKEESRKYDKDNNGEFEISYDLKNGGNVYSIIIESFKLLPGMAHPEEKKYYFNLDVENNKILNISDLFKSEKDYKNIINREIKSQIEIEKESYFETKDGFTGIKDDQDFYVDGFGNIIFEFDKYEIAPGATGRPSFKISGYKIKDILRDEYDKFTLKSLDKIMINGLEVSLDRPMYLSEKGNLMIPLVDLVTNLGFEVDWDGNTGSVILKHDETLISISTRENEFKFNDSIVVLEEGARIKEGHSYLPESFLNRVLYSRLDIVDGVLDIKY